MGDQESFLDVVNCMLRVSFVYVYALLDLGATLCFITSLVSRMFDILPDILN